MNGDLQTVIEENNRLLLENLELSKQNSKKIKKIHSYMRRTFFAKILYWIVIILVTVGAFYYIQPHVNRVLESYKNLTEQISTTTGYITNPGSLLPEKLDSDSLFTDVDLLKSIFGGEESG